MWGHTWKDLETANVTMRRPWTVLRALGLYKRPDAEYGVDFVSSASQRMANEYFGFTDEDLDTFVRLGGFKALPQWLQGQVDDETTWHEFLLDTLFRCEDFMRSASTYSAVVYCLLCSIAGLVSFGSFMGGVRRFGSALFHLTIMYGIIFALFKSAIKHVDESHWARDLRNELRYTSPFGAGFSEYTYDGPLTVPHRNDVLIETRYKSDYLAMFSNDFIGNFPGNRLWNELVNEKAALYASYLASGLPPAFSEAIPEFIVSGVDESAGRFLYQTWQSHWAEMSFEDSVKHTRLELAIKSNSILTNVIKEVEFLLSETKYGSLRTTAMMENDVFPFLLDLKERLIGNSNEETRKNTTTVRAGKTPTPQFRQFAVASFLSKPQTVAKFPFRPVVLHVGQHPEEPEPDAWLREGDVVDVKIKERGRRRIYKATLTHALSSGICFVLTHIDEERHQVECKTDLRHYVLLNNGDKVEVLIDDKFYSGTIVEEKGDDFYDVQVSGRIFEDVGGDLFRRTVNTRHSQ